MAVTPRQHHSLTLDEVIAANVRRLREEKGYSVAEVAEALGLGRHAIYDYERPRRESQHSFRWTELVSLCSVFECALFELVLPEPEIRVDVPKRIKQGVATRVASGPRETFESENGFGWSTTLPTRSELSWLLFHFDVKDLDERALADWMKREAERRRLEALAIAEEVWEQFGGKPDFVYDPAYEEVDEQD